MKKIFLWAVLCSCYTTTLFAQNVVPKPNPILFPVLKEGSTQERFQWTFVDTNGKEQMSLPPMAGFYSQEGSVFENLSRTPYEWHTFFGDNGWLATWNADHTKVQYIDSIGNTTLDLSGRFWAIEPFHNGVAIAHTFRGEGLGTYEQYINEKGELLLDKKIRFEESEPFNKNGWARVRETVQEGYYFFNKNGKKFKVPFPEGLVMDLPSLSDNNIGLCTYYYEEHEGRLFKIVDLNQGKIIDFAEQKALAKNTTEVEQTHDFFRITEYLDEDMSQMQTYLVNKEGKTFWTLKDRPTIFAANNNVITYRKAPAFTLTYDNGEGAAIASPTNGISMDNDTLFAMDTKGKPLFKLPIFSPQIEAFPAFKEGKLALIKQENDKKIEGYLEENGKFTADSLAHRRLCTSVYYRDYGYFVEEGQKAFNELFCIKDIRGKKTFAVKDPNTLYTLDMTRGIPNEDVQYLALYRSTGDSDFGEKNDKKAPLDSILPFKNLKSLTISDYGAQKKLFEDWGRFSDLEILTLENLPELRQLSPTAAKLKKLGVLSLLNAPVSNLSEILPQLPVLATITYDTISVSREQEAKLKLLLPEVQFINSTDYLKQMMDEGYEGYPIPFYDVEVKPIFEGGDEALAQFIKEKAKEFKPQKSEPNSIVSLYFVINEDGSIGDIETIESPSPAHSAAARKIIAAMPKWTAGKQNGENVKVGYDLTITF